MFHPMVARWFTDRIGEPTDIQGQAWPRIARGEHLLITAPTGSGKTLAAFLWAVNQWIKGEWRTGYTRVLYISPLRALNYDIQRNLLVPLHELYQAFRKAGESFPEIRVVTRSGDTPPADRRQMLRHPPEILITTPESLNLILSSPQSRALLANVRSVILDEIHAVVSTKRGTYLITAVDRLVRLAGEFQRIALSATLQPLATVAEFVGGFSIERSDSRVHYHPRPVAIIQSTTPKKYDLKTQAFPESAGLPPSGSLWDPMAEEMKRIIRRNRSTLLFVNSRRLCETLALKINEGEKEPLAYSHHGSLSREIRNEVERRFKAGDLRAIVATNSLELGIDIGALEEVLLIQSPFSISSAIQRVGRAGHQVGEISRGTFFPTHPKDLLEAAVLTQGIMAQDIEAVRPVRRPLDVLAQILVSMVGVETWDLDDLYEEVQASTPYRDLSREQFDLVLHMLSGRYAGSRIRELRPLISVDRLDHTVAARKGALQTLYLAGGVIPDRGYFHLRHLETNARIGELDEEFVWEAAVGETFMLGAQNWRIERITHNDVFVLPAHPRATAAPFWKGEENGRDFHFSQNIGLFLEEANARLEDPEFSEFLTRRYNLDAAAAEQLVFFLKKQRMAMGCDLPHRHHFVVEFISRGPGGAPGNQAVIHTFWGGRVNRPLAVALEAAWEANFGQRLEFYASDDCLVILLPHEIRGEELVRLVKSSEVETLLRSRLEDSGFFGARFRECAGRALLLSRDKFNERMPLWLSRLRSQKLLDAVRHFPDFPILLEAWRTCLKDEFDMESLHLLLGELESGAIAWSEVHTAHPSPFVQSEWWRQINEYMYMDDSSRSGRPSKLRESLLADVVFTPGLRPTISPELVKQFEEKRKRLSLGYSPNTPRELLDWTVERLLLPAAEWETLLAAMGRDHGVDLDGLLAPLRHKIVRLFPRAAEAPLVAAQETIPRIMEPFYGEGQDVVLESLDKVPLPRTYEKVEDSAKDQEETASLLGEWLQFYGPIPIASVSRTLGLEMNRLQSFLEDLIDEQKIIKGRLVTNGSSEEICDSQNYGTLLRMARSSAVPAFEPLPIEDLALFLADYQGITHPRNDSAALPTRTEQLLFYPLEAGVWESEIFPARLQSYDPSGLDNLMLEKDLKWVGGEGHRILFCFGEDLDLLPEVTNDLNEASAREGVESSGPPEERVGVEIAPLFPDPAARYDFPTLVRLARAPRAELAQRLWEGVWRGNVTNDTFISLRRAAMNHFKMPATLQAEPAPPKKHFSHRAGLARRKGEDRFFAGNWYMTSTPEIPEDLLEMEERRKDRARLLLDRYGILFRELLLKELPGLRWSSIFRSLRIMELSGELLSGYFFKGIPGPQFMSPQTFRHLQQPLPREAVFWLNAVDPASLCGLGLETLRGELPSRIESTHLVYRGEKVVLISRRYGRDLGLRISPDDPDFPKYMAPLHHLLTRRFQPLPRIAVETINEEKASASPYLSALRACFEVRVDYKSVNLSSKNFLG